MINFFDKLYSLRDGSRLFAKLRIYSLRRFAIRSVVNTITPSYFMVSNFFNKTFLKESDKSRGRIIVSLTSFPLRINRVWLVIECLMRQKTLPDKIILWLSLDQFKSLEILPKKLLKYQKRGLEIRLCAGDLRSHKKYYYVMQEFKDDFIITVDDDLFYASNLIGDLVDLYNDNPSCICCHRALEIGRDNDQIEPYKTWSLLKQRSGPSYNVFQTSGGGTLFPPSSLPDEVFNRSVFIKYCFQADDVWLNAMANIKGTKTVKSSYFTNYIPIFVFNNINLSTTNVGQDLNDRQIRDVRAYYLNKFETDPFSTWPVNKINQDNIWLQ